MAKSLIHMIPGQEAMWNKSAATTATGMTASTAAERHRQYQQQQQQSSSSSTILSSGNLSGLSKTTKSEGHEVARTPSIISTTTASQSSSNDTVTVTTTDYDSAPLDSNQQHQQQVSTKTDDQVLLAIAEIESYIDLTRQHSSITNEEMPFLTKPATPYVPLPKEDDVFLHQEEKKEDPFNSNERVSVATNDQIDNHKDSSSIPSVFPFTSLPVVDEADEEGEEVVAPSDLIGGATCTNDKPALPSNHGGRLRIEGLFGLSMSSLHANNKVRRASAQVGVASNKHRKTVGKVSVQQDGSTRHDDVEMIPQQESTSICIDSTRSVSSAVVSQNLPRVLRQPTTPLSRSYESLEAMRSSLRAKVSVANSSPDVFEVVSGELVSTNITSPSEALSRRTSCKMTPASVVFSQAEIGVDDAKALATLKRVVSTSQSVTTTDDGIEIPNETERLNILRATSSDNSAGVEEYQFTIPFGSDVKVEELEDTIELTRTRTIRPTATQLTDSFEEVEELLQVHVENHDDSIELLRTRTEGSWQAEEYEPSVHSSAITVPTTKFSKEFVRTLYLSGTDETLRSARIINQDNEAIRVLSRDMAKESAARVDGAEIPVSIDDKRDYAIEVQRPGSSSSMFSRNAPFQDPSANVEKDILITARSGPYYDQSIRSGTSPKQKKGCLDKDIAEISDQKNLALSDLQEGTQLISLEEETLPLSDPAPESKNIVESNISKQLRINGPASAFFQDENPAPSQQPLMTDETTKLAPREANIAVSIPKIPAPRNDTTSIHDVGAMLEQSLEIASRRKRLHFISQEQKKAAVLVPNDSKTETKAIASDKEGVEVAPEEEFPDPFLCTPEHMVHVKVLGIAGIVVDRAVCGTDNGQKAFPAAPEGMKVVVGMTERGSDQIIGVTASSKTLIPSPNGMLGGTKHRHVAVWVSDNDAMTPGSLISSDLITMERVDPENPKSRYKPRFFDLTVALAKDAHVAIPIGVAKLKVNGDFVNHGELVTMDLPVYSMEQQQKHNEMNAKGGGIMSPAIQCIKLKNKDTKKSGIKSMFQRKSLDHESDAAPTQEEQKALLAAYGIDPAGDSMIRVQVRVETLGMYKDGEMNEKYDPSAQTVATEPTEDGSLESSLPGNKEESNDTAGGKVKKELIDKAKPLVVQLNEAEQTVELESIATESLYSKPLLDTTGKVSTSGPPTNTKMEDETFQLPICGKSLAFPTCGSTQEFSKEQEIKHVGGIQNDSSHTTTSVQDNDDNVNDTATVEEDDSVPIQDGSFYASLSDIGGHVSTGSTIGPVPTVDEIKAYLKEQFGVFVLKSGEFFFPEDPSLANDDISSIGDATLEAFMNGQLRMRTMDSGTWQKSPRGGGDDDSRTYNSIATHESEPTLMLQPFGDSAAKGKTNNNDKKKTPMATVEEEDKPVDPPAIKRNSGSLSKSQRVTSQLEGENENENDDDGSLVVNDDDDDDENNNDGDDEMSLRTPRSTKRGSSHNSSCNNSQSSRPKSVAESLAESLVGVLSRYPMCGGAGYSVDPKWSCSETDHRMKIPRTVDPDVMSVGDLTAATLEEHHHHHPLERDAAAQRAGTSGNGGSRSRLKIDPSMLVSSLRSAASGWFVCGSTDNVDDSVLARRRSTPIQFTASGSSAMLKVSTTNSMLDHHPIHSSTVGGREGGGGEEEEEEENYFAEYEEEHLEESDVVVAKEERRVDPPADPPAADRCCTMIDDEGSCVTTSTTTARTVTQLQQQKPKSMCTDFDRNKNGDDDNVDVVGNDTRVLPVHHNETDEC
ncbi:hypothetical protein IV203_004624 [Nitzschia inconspicua]|uniref:Uncharacterized protein n=1 Tax=Nitzschia inconspicua TaxID=303405 RepID=A0A9K3L3Y2_9STRA|nr:hypothetical protein IV203_004624 [Nitzschia inconspicua]